MYTSARRPNAKSAAPESNRATASTAERRASRVRESSAASWRLVTP